MITWSHTGHAILKLIRFGLHLILARFGTEILFECHQEHISVRRLGILPDVLLTISVKLRIQFYWIFLSGYTIRSAIENSLHSADIIFVFAYREKLISCILTKSRRKDCTEWSFQGLPSNCGCNTKLYLQCVGFLVVETFNHFCWDSGWKITLKRG